MSLDQHTPGCSHPQHACEFCGYAGPGLTITDPKITGSKRACFACYVERGGKPKTRLNTLARRGLHVICLAAVRDADVDHQARLAHQARIDALLGTAHE